MVFISKEGEQMVADGKGWYKYKGDLFKTKKQSQWPFRDTWLFFVVFGRVEEERSINTISLQWKYTASVIIIFITKLKIIFT